MVTFLEEIIDTLKEKHGSLSQCHIILPSKRAGSFFKSYLKNRVTTTGFAPTIISIEEFIEQLSGLQIIDSTELIFKSYETYLKTDAFKEKEEFETYTTWVNTLLNDFNEVDRYLVDPKQFFSYLGSIKTLEKWNVQDEQTPLIKQYLTFWDNLQQFYSALQADLLDQKIAYQGLAYRKASEAVLAYTDANKHTPHIFIGFNALNAAEQNIVQTLLSEGTSEIYWDIDSYFLNDKKHSVSRFIRGYLSQWSYYQKDRTPVLPTNYEKPKQILAVEVQKNIGQAKYIGQLLETYSQEKLNQTTVVLADENLLLPLLHSLPNNVSSVNITMGVPLKSVPIAVFFEILIAMHATAAQSYYYKEVLAILNHPVCSSLLTGVEVIGSQINERNATHLSLEDLMAFSKEEDQKMLRHLFSSWEGNSKAGLHHINSIINHLKRNPNINKIQRVALFQLNETLEKITAFQQKYSHLKTIKTLQSLFLELIATTTIDFKGDAYSGLQIMGVLETRVLDFKNIIMASVNEGVLPAGKSNSSFITYDLKRAFNLPLYTEKDAIYTYHFYRLLQRAEDIVLLYNNHSEGINTGEKSRFLLQLEIENLPNHILKKEILSPTITIPVQALKTVEKTEALMDRLQELAGSKFSPSALTSYIRNQIEFYFQKVLRIDDTNEVEETVAANTLGTIVHESLETLYTPFLNKPLTIDGLKAIKPTIDKEVRHQFDKNFSGGVIDKGKNLLIFEVAKRYILNLINYEIECLQSGDTITILALEKKMKVPLDIPQLNFPVFLGGTVDRVDTYNGVMRIIDYKTGAVKKGDVEIIDWEELSTDYKYSKAFQVLAYATMMVDEFNGTTCEAGIISFKNLQEGFLKFATKDSPWGKKEHAITSETIDTFKEQLTKLIVEICDPATPFTEKEIE